MNPTPDVGQVRSAVVRAVVTPLAAVVGLWDPLRLDQIATNLVSNAIKYGEGRPIDVAVGGDADRAWLVVSDRGIGIAPADRPRVFERFARAVPDEAYVGLGLGL
jgi:signal transduction histidine kinase